MKRWMTSLAPNRRTKFVSFTSRLLGTWPIGTAAPAGRGRWGWGAWRRLCRSRAAVSALGPLLSLYQACEVSGKPASTALHAQCQLSAPWRT